MASISFTTVALSISINMSVAEMDANLSAPIVVCRTFLRLLMEVKRERMGGKRREG